MELKRCARCGSFFVSEDSVCVNCSKKDSADVLKLKGFLESQTEEIIDKDELATFTGISIKNIDRYLSMEEFSNIEFDNLKQLESEDKKFSEIL